MSLKIFVFVVFAERRREMQKLIHVKCYRSFRNGKKNALENKILEFLTQNRTQLSLPGFRQELRGFLDVSQVSFHKYNEINLPSFL